MKFPVYRPSLNGNEKKYVNECLESTWISSKGKFVTEFERKFGQFVNAPHSVAVCNGTVALHVALEALGLGPGDEIIVPTLTYIASVNAITYTGATPVFVDSTEDYWQIDPIDVATKITPRTKAIMCVHLYGHACPMAELVELSNRNNLYLIEDCAEAIGTTYRGTHVGTFGDVATFSFYGNKTITTGEGGMVITKSSDLHQKIVHLKGQGLAKNREYWHDVIGYNYRMTNICAAIGVAQLEQVDSVIEQKRQLAEWYRDALEATPYKFHEQTEGTIHSYWMCSILIPRYLDREELKLHLAQLGIETRPMFYPIHSMPMYNRKGQNFPVAEKLAMRGLNLPSYPELSKTDVEFIVDALKSLLNLPG